MDDRLLEQAIQRAVKPKFKGRKTLRCKVGPRYPSSMEREMQRLTDQYNARLQEIVNRHMEEIAAAVRKNGGTGEHHADSLLDIVEAVRSAFTLIDRDMEDETRRFGLWTKLQKLANMTAKLSIKDWKRMVSATLGIDLLDDYYSGHFYQSLLDQWVKNNVSYIQSIPQTSFRVMEKTVIDSFRQGKTMKSISNEIQHTFRVNKGKARLLARDQMGTLNSQITQKQHQDAGVTEYYWRTCKDQRVRDSHRHLEGKRFRYDSPPLTGSGRRCNPGRDYQCRCYAEPIFDFENLNLTGFPKGGS